MLDWMTFCGYLLKDLDQACLERCSFSRLPWSLLYIKVAFGTLDKIHTSGLN